MQIARTAVFVSVIIAATALAQPINRYTWSGKYQLTPSATLGTNLPPMDLPSSGSVSLVYGVLPMSPDLNPGAFGRYEIQRAWMTFSSGGAPWLTLPAVLFGTSLGSVTLIDFTLLPDEVSASSLWLGSPIEGYAERSILAAPPQAKLSSPIHLPSDAQPLSPLFANLARQGARDVAFTLQQDILSPLDYRNLDFTLSFDRFNFVPVPSPGAAACAVAGLSLAFVRRR